MSEPYLNSYRSTKKVLLEMLMCTSLPGNKLPSEAELAKRMRVSIVTLRQALTALESEGYITKKPGLGSFVHPHALERFMRADMAENMVGFVESSGRKTVVKANALFERPAEGNCREPLELEADEAVLVFELVYHGDDQIVVVARNYIPKKYLTREAGDAADITAIDQFIWAFCGRTLAYEITTWVSTTLSDELAELFQTKAGQPLLEWRQTVYDDTETAVCYSEVFFSPTFGSPRVLRKWSFNPQLNAEIL